MRRLIPVTVGAFVLVALPAGANDPVVGSERHSNASAGFSLAGALATPPSGALLAVWADLAGTDGDGAGIFGRFLEAGGEASGPSFRINSTTSGDQERPDVAATPSGSFIVVWESEGGDGSGRGVLAQRLDAAGVAVGTEFVVNEYATTSQNAPRVVALAGGGFVVVWSDEREGYSDLGVFGRVFDSAGVSVGGDFGVATQTSFDEHAPDVGVLATGFVVAWESSGAGGIFAQRFDATGATVGTEFQADQPGGSGAREPRVGGVGDGSFVIGWSEGPGGSPIDVLIRRYDVSGLPVGSEQVVTSATGGSQELTGVETRSDGTFVLTWYRDPFQASREVLFRRYDASGAPTTGEKLLSANPAATGNAVTTLLPGSGMLAVWSGALPGKLDATLTWTPVCEDPGPDADGDQIGDACDPCVGPQPIDVKPSVQLRFLGGEIGNEGAKLRGEFALPEGSSFTSIDPFSVPVRVRVATTTGRVPIDVALPTTPFAGHGSAGWRTNGNGTKWSFRDKTGSPRNGLVQVTLQDRSAKAPRTIRFKAKSKDGAYSAFPGDEPLAVTLSVAEPLAGQCGETAFAASDCSFLGLGKGLKCKQ